MTWRWRRARYHRDDGPQNERTAPGWEWVTTSTNAVISVSTPRCGAIGPIDTRSGPGWRARLAAVASSATMPVNASIRDTARVEDADCAEAEAPQLLASGRVGRHGAARGAPEHPQRGAVAAGRRPVVDDGQRPVDEVTDEAGEVLSAVDGVDDQRAGDRAVEAVDARGRGAGIAGGDAARQPDAAEVGVQRTGGRGDGITRPGPAEDL